VNKREINLAVESEGQFLAKGDSARGLTCPVCGGGNNAERTFSVTRVDGGLVYNCYRATCGTRGFVPTSGVLIPAKPYDPNQGLRPYHGEYRPITDEDREYFAQRFGLFNVPEFAIGHNEWNEYVFAVRGPDGLKVRGYTIRQKPWSGEPASPRVPVPHIGSDSKSKSKLLMHAQGAAQSWFFSGSNPERGPIVLVEDHISAMKVAQAGVTGVALIGTNIDEAKVREIAMLKPSEVVIALDQDATGTAFKHARRWGLAFDKVRVAMLMFDIKDTDPEKVLGVLGL
jgi:hypothetical protein